MYGNMVSHFNRMRHTHWITVNLNINKAKQNKHIDEIPYRVSDVG